MSGGFNAAELFKEVRSTASFRQLSESEWSWVLDFLVSGGRTLSAYPQYHKLVLQNGVYKVEDPTIAKRHRMVIGTIVSDASV